MDLRERLKDYHEKEGVSYKFIAQQLGVTVGVMYNYTSGIRELKEQIQERLDQFLKERGY